MATPTPYDQASRYLVKLNPHLTLAWLMQESPANFRFEGWMDRTVSDGLGYPDKMSDTVAILERLDVIEATWLGDTEYQASPDSDMVYRVRDYTNNLERYCRPPNANRGDRYNVGAIVINLTGIQGVPPAKEWANANFLTQTKHRVVNMETLNADTIMQGILSGALPENLLGFIPLMQNGNTPAIIEQWKARVMLIEGRSLRADLGQIATTFAELVDTRSVWDAALEGWNMVESKYWKEQNAIAIALTEARTTQELTRKHLLEILASRFGESPFHQELINQVADVDRLNRMWRASLGATSWDTVTSVE